jgi:methylphosphotriester-DNA--protein-cysteine methyltransferase
MEIVNLSAWTSIAAQLAEMTTNTERAQSIQQAKDAISIGSLAKLYISQDDFEKRFRKTVGMTAKQFSSLVRLRHIINSYTPEKAHTLTHLAHSAGYFDQARLTHVFQRFTGQPPRQFFANANYW